MKTPFRRPVMLPASADFKRIDDVHDVARKATPDARTKHTAQAFINWVGDKDINDLPAKDAFMSGFDAGEAYGTHVGFSRGATEVLAGLTHSRGRSKKRLLATGNELAEPSNKLEAINEEQLTAEVIALLADYAVVKTDLRVRAVLDALNTLPGVNIRI